MARGKNVPSSSFFVLALLSLALGFAGAAGANEWSYAGDPGFVATNPNEVAAAKQSWETTEYFGSGGLKHLKASSAYALGFFGQNRIVGVMDSGSLQSHEAFQNIVTNGVVTKNWNFVTQEGTYTTTGTRYAGAGANLTNGGLPYTSGQAFSLTGAYDPSFNDSHGTSVAGIVSANRDNSTTSGDMHGIAWASNIVVGNTGATDSNNYGPFQDPGFFKTSFSAMVEAGAEVINNSWGTNPRINLEATPNFPASMGGLTADQGGRPNNAIVGIDGAPVGNHIWTNNVPQAEYEYFLYKQRQGDYTWMDATFDAVRGTDVVYIMTTGNRDNANPFYRALYPYFNPEAERNWIAAAGIKLDPTDSTKLTIVDSYNEAGLAKWWTVTGYTLNDAFTTNLAGGYNSYSFSGTSCAAPHIAGAMGVLLSRYPNMSAAQVRDVMFTTARRTNDDGTLFNGWTSAAGVPDERYGWGLPDLEKGMYGPGQFLGRFEYNASAAPLDVWSNNITNEGLDARKAEDEAWLAEYEKTLPNKLAGLGLYNNGMDGRGGLLSPGTTEEYAKTGDYFLGDAFVIMDNDDDPTNHIISQANAEKWRMEYAAKRAEDIRNKLANNLYSGSLVKKGPGTLVMTGDNTYEGGTTVEEGALYGFTESFGTGAVNVNGGAFGVLSKYNDLFTMKGELTSTQSRLATINVNNGGTFVIVGGENVNVGALNFNKGSKIQIGIAGTDILRDIYQDPTLTTSGTVATTALTGINNMVVEPDWAFFNMDVTVAPQDRAVGGSVAEGSAAVITGELSWNNTGLASYASDGNGRSVAEVLSTNVPNSIMDSLFWSTKDQARNTLDSLGNDLYLTADTASIINSLSLARTIKNQALGSNSRRSTAISETARVWATGVGNWSTVDLGGTDLDSEFYTGFLGIETDITPNHKIGLFAGAGWSEFDGGRNGKIESDDMHFGLYGVSRVADSLQLAYGGMYTRQEREGRRDLTIIEATQKNQEDYNTDIGQLFLEAAYTGFNNERFAIEPYAGVNVLWLNSDSIKERIGAYDIKTGKNEQVVEAATIGLRGSLPLYATETGSFALRGDISGTAFMGDTRPEANLWIDNIGKAKLRGGRMDDPMLNVGLGFDAGFKSVKFGLAYEGAFNSDIQSNGVVANILINF